MRKRYQAAYVCSLLVCACEQSPRSATTTAVSPASREQTPVAPVAAPPVAAPTGAAADHAPVTLFANGESREMVLSGAAAGRIFARPDVFGESMAILWRGVGPERTVGTCSVNLAAQVTVTATQRRDGFLYVTCTTAAHSQESDDVAVLRIATTGANAPTVVGVASPQDGNGDPAALAYQPPSTAAAEDPGAVAARWLAFVRADDREAGSLSAFPITIRANDAATPAPCGGRADALQFHDSARHCLSELLRFDNAVFVEEPPRRELQRLLPGHRSDRLFFIGFGSELGPEVMKVVIAVAPDGGVRAIALETLVDE